MKRAVAGVMIMLVGLLMQAGLASAATTSEKVFTIAAAVPAGTSVGIKASKVTGTGTSAVFSDQASPLLSFDPMELDPKNKIWLPKHSYAIDVAPNGAGTMSVSVVYAEGANPNGAGKGLGTHATATFVKTIIDPNNAAKTVDSILTSHGVGGKKRLLDITGENISSAEVRGGWFRMYLGIVSKDPAASPLDPENSDVFTNADKPGLYDGTLTITATLS